MKSDDNSTKLNVSKDDVNNNHINNSSNSSTRKKFIGLIALGGLILTGPFAVFALNSNTVNSSQFTNSNFNINNLDTNLINEPDYDKQIEKLEKEINAKISQANSLIKTMDESSVNIDELNNIISEYVRLETFLEEVQYEKQESDYLKEIFFEEKSEFINLSDEFRNILTANIDAKVDNKKNQDIEMNFNDENFTSETLKMIDSDLAKSYSNGDLTLEEVKEKVKNLMS